MGHCMACGSRECVGDCDNPLSNAIARELFRAQDVQARPVYKILVTTMMTQTVSGAREPRAVQMLKPTNEMASVSTALAVHTLVVEFDSQEAAEAACSKINAVRHPDAVRQTAITLF
jgi:hypothetical protein